MSEKTCRLCGHNYDYMKTDDQATCPLCGDTGNQRPRMSLDQPRAPRGAASWDWLRARFEGATTDQLELELKTLSERIASDPVRFDEVREELARRRIVKDEQPAPDLVTSTSKEVSAIDNANDVIRTLTNKVIAMETEQAKLVLEAEAAKAAQREAEDRLALIARKLSDVVQRADAQEAPKFERGHESAE